jgi:hypothetical protein
VGCRGTTYDARHRPEVTPTLYSWAGAPRPLERLSARPISRWWGGVRPHTTPGRPRSLSLLLLEGLVTLLILALLVLSPLLEELFVEALEFFL